MTDCHGMELCRAREILGGEGFAVREVEARSRKGSGGSALRVIRQTRADDKTVLLVFSYIKDRPTETVTQSDE